MDAALPPGPRAPRALQMSGWLARPLWFASQCRARFGDTFTVRIEERPWVMLADPAAIREVFTAPPDLVHAGDANAILRPMLGPSSVLLLDGAEHLHQRRLMLPAFHGARLQRYRDIMVEATDRALAGWRPGDQISLRPHAQAITLEVIVRAVFGVSDSAAHERLRALLSDVLDRLTRVRRMVRIAAAGPNSPRIVALFRRELADVDAELHRLIAARRTAADLAERDDVLSMLLLARDEDGRGLSDAELRDELMTLLVAGHETTANTLAWAFERLSRTPGGLERVASDAAYAEAAVRETLRLRPVLAVVARRLATGAPVRGPAPPPAAAAGHRGGRAAADAGCHDRRPAAARGHRRRAVHPARPPPARRLPRARRVPPRALPRPPARHVHVDPVRRRRPPLPRRVVRADGARGRAAADRAARRARAGRRPRAGAPSGDHARPRARRRRPRARAPVAGGRPWSRTSSATSRPASRRSRSTGSARCPTSPRRTTGSSGTSRSTSGSRPRSPAGA